MIKRQKRFKNFTWIDIAKPSQKDVKTLAEKYNFHPLDIEDIISPVTMSKVESYNDYLFLLLELPCYNRKTGIIKPAEIDIFVTKDTLITLHKDKVYTINHVFKDIGKHAKSIHMALYFIIDKLIDRSLPMLQHITEDINEMEENIFSGQEKKTVNGISIIRRNVTDFHRIINPLTLALEDLERRRPKFFPKNYGRYIDQLKEESQRVNKIIANQKETMLHLQSTNESLIANKLTIVMRILTIFSAISMPLALVVSIFDVQTIILPELPTESSFWLAVIVMAVAVSMLLLLFKLKRWL